MNITIFNKISKIMHNDNLKLTTYDKKILNDISDGMLYDIYVKEGILINNKYYSDDNHNISVGNCKVNHIGISLMKEKYGYMQVGLHDNAIYRLEYSVNYNHNPRLYEIRNVHLKTPMQIDKNRHTSFMNMLEYMIILKKIIWVCLFLPGLKVTRDDFTEELTNKNFYVSDKSILSISVIDLNKSYAYCNNSITIENNKQIVLCIFIYFNEIEINIKHAAFSKVAIDIKKILEKLHFFPNIEINIKEAHENLPVII